MSFITKDLSRDPPIMIGCGILVLLAVAVIYMLVTLPEKIEHHNRLSYSSWAKDTGNPGHLTYEEWLHLPRDFRKH